jgi:hypothetical protein
VSTYGCPNCGGARCTAFHHIARVPVNSCLLFADRAPAQSVAVGDIDLAFCPDCSFIFNAAWKPDRTVYSDQYEETQGFSPTFSRFHRRLAEDLIERYDLKDKLIVEIGCGKGEFLSLLCSSGGNRGVGYDPSFIPERRGAGGADVVFKQEYFSESSVQSPPDFICCKMTLEHIAETRRFVQAVRRVASAERGTTVFFQIPDVRRILAEGAFWDVYYEHCSYFSPRSLAHLFRSTGFKVLRLSSEFDDQYLTVEATADDGARAAAFGDLREEDLVEGVTSFADTVGRNVDQWSTTVAEVTRSGGRTVLWGSGSKAVAFLSALGEAGKAIDYLVDINPHRWEKFVPGTGKQIVRPEFLTGYRPDLVIAMNPVYRLEIAVDLTRVECGASRLLALGEPCSPPVAAAATPAVELRA